MEFGDQMWSCRRWCVRVHLWDVVPSSRTPNFFSAVFSSSFLGTRFLFFPSLGRNILAFFAHPLPLSIHHSQPMSTVAGWMGRYVAVTATLWVLDALDSTRTANRGTWTLVDWNMEFGDQMCSHSRWFVRVYVCACASLRCGSFFTHTKLFFRPFSPPVS